jgi:CMP-N,N'-diacetyllegionaminic acid synthase
MYKGKKVLALIPARANSKRLPNKNVLDLGGKPVIGWTITEAKKSRYIDDIVVSTNSKNIANISTEQGGFVPFLRPEELASDHAKSIDVIKHALSYYDEKKAHFDLVILLQPTSPLRTASDIDEALELIGDDVKAVVSVCQTGQSQFWCNTLPTDFSMKDFINPDVLNSRQEELPVYYKLNGAIYIAEIKYFLKHQGFFGHATKAFLMPAERSIDIDVEIDLQFAEFLLRKKNSS